MVPRSATAGRRGRDGEVDNDHEQLLEDKRADFFRVKVPAYIRASYSADSHTVGSLRVYEEIPHPNKCYLAPCTMEGEKANTKPGLFFTLSRSGMTYTPWSAPRT